MTDAITYLEEKHRLRRNVLTGELLYADNDSEQCEHWHRLSKEGRNTLILEAERDGVMLTDETLDRFAHSTLIDPWNPRANGWTIFPNGMAKTMSSTSHNVS